MSYVFVRCLPEEERMRIALNYIRNGEAARSFNLERLQSEEVGKCLARLKTNIVKTNCKRKKKKQNGEEQPETLLEIQVLINKVPVSSDTPNNEAWVAGSVLKIEDTELEVDFNPPTIKSLSLPKYIMVGYPIYPKLAVELAEVQSCEFIWYKFLEDGNKNMEAPTLTMPTITKPEKATNALNVENSEVEWNVEFIEVSQSRTYIPTPEDIGHKMRLDCIPKRENREGRKVTTVAESQVISGPCQCYFEKRPTANRANPGCFRVVSYNILADPYADSDYARNELYPYCPPYALNLDYRKQLLLRELQGYNADIICLQEVDLKVFIKDLQPILMTHDFAGVMRTKGGSQGCEGSATFYRLSNFRLVSQHDVEVSRVLKTEELYQDLREKVYSSESLKGKMEQLKTVLQVTVLEHVDDPKSKLCVANTHLYFHPGATHIRIIQSVICVRHLQQVMEEYRAKGDMISLIFCGDFNNTPGDAANTFMVSGHVTADHQDWKECCYGSLKSEEQLEGMDFSHNLNLISACGFPPYTNYTPKWHGTLDYIYISTDTLCVDQIIPMPDHKDVIENVALPSVGFPSDHIALICDIGHKVSGTTSCNTSQV